jgi:predicted MPP superfamily phosphohydrolase
MAPRFYLVATVFHSILLATGWATARRWSLSLGPGSSRSGGILGLVRDTAAFLVLSVLLALAAAAAMVNGFTAIRLLSQTLFGELLALVVWASMLLWRRGSGAPAVLASLIAGSLLAVYAEAYHREPEDLQVRRQVVDRSANTAARRSLRILHLSDLQADRIGRYQRHALTTALQEQPDLIVLTGDYVQPRLHKTRDRATADLNALLREIRFDAPLGAFAVRGDVDIDWPLVFAGTSVRPLTGESVRLTLPALRSSLTLVGLTPAMSHGRDPRGLLDLVRRAPPADLRIVAGHGPDFVAELAGQVPVDLALAGHTHGGQIVLPFVGALYTKSTLPRAYASGLHDFGGILINVSAGVGMERGTAPQVRFLCPPEISVIDIRF